MNNLSIKKIGNIVGIASLAFFFLCIVWGVFIVSPDLKELHYNLVLITYPGFSFGLIGILIGAVEAYVYGLIIGAFFGFLCKKFSVEK